MDTGTAVPCPFCDFSDADTYFLMQHVELCHPENGTSPFIATDGSIDDNHLQLDEASRKPSGWDGETLYNDDNADGDTTTYIDCPTGCGEAIARDELESHLDLHLAEGIALDETNALLKGSHTIKDHQSGGTAGGYNFEGLDDNDSELSPELNKALNVRDEAFQEKHGRKGKWHTDRPVNSQPKASQRSKNTGTKTTRRARQRLGTAELGPHAHEKQMPGWLRKMLEDGPKITQEYKFLPNGSLHKVESVTNETPRLIPVLAQLCEFDDSVEQAFLCNPNVRHIFKMPKEGGFCGYRNIQMLISYIQGSKAYGHEHFPGRAPSILKLQDIIEDAWDNGFNSHGRVETGGVKGTRKYIGTSEAVALFRNLGIECNPAVCASESGVPAYEILYKTVAEYFLNSNTPPKEGKQVVQTTLPPIYLQHRGHSMTIVGVELRKNDRVNLLVFDPMFKTAPAASKLIDTRIKPQNPAALMKAFRRLDRYLQRYDSFELLMLSPKIESDEDISKA